MGALRSCTTHVFSCLVLLIVVADRHLSRSAVVVSWSRHLGHRERLLALAKHSKIASVLIWNPFLLLAQILSHTHTHMLSLALSISCSHGHSKCGWNVCCGLDVAKASPAPFSSKSPGLGFAFTVWCGRDCTPSSPVRISQQPVMFSQGEECKIMCLNELSHN